MSKRADFLDRFLPLKGASHADVVGYQIVIPMRYAECVAVLEDGGHVPLRNPRQLLGWRGPAERRTILFTSESFSGACPGIEIRVATRRKRQLRAVHHCELRVCDTTTDRRGVQKLVARDGELILARQPSRTRIWDIAGFGHAPVPNRRATDPVLGGAAL